MKKLLSIFLTMVIVLSLSTSAVLAAETDLERVSNDVHKTNQEIDQMINEAVHDAKTETWKYMKELEILENGKEIVNLKEDIAELQKNLNVLDINEKDYLDKLNKISKEISKKENQLSKIVQDQEERNNNLISQFNELKSELSNLENGSKKTVKVLGVIMKFEEKLDKSNIKAQELTNTLNGKMEKIINNLINETNKKSADMKKRAADKGITVICELVEVQIGDQGILIDPLRIAGY